jgi:hypothetical protein
MEMYLIVLARKVFCLNCERVPRSEEPFECSQNNYDGQNLLS